MAADRSRIHNETAPRLIREMARIAGDDKVALNILAESLLVGVGMLNYPGDARRQALIIQEIADGAQDRARAIGQHQGGGQ